MYRGTIAYDARCPKGCPSPNPMRRNGKWGDRVWLREYQRAWREKNREHYRAYCRNYYMLYRGRIAYDGVKRTVRSYVRPTDSKWEDKEWRSAYLKAWREKNADHVIAYRNAYKKRAKA